MRVLRPVSVGNMVGKLVYVVEDRYDESDPIRVELDEMPEEVVEFG